MHQERAEEGQRKTWRFPQWDSWLLAEQGDQEIAEQQIQREQAGMFLHQAGVSVVVACTPARISAGIQRVGIVVCLLKGEMQSVRQAEQETPPSQTYPPEYANSTECAKQPPECAKQQATQASRGKMALSSAESTVAAEWQAQLLAIASDLLYWKGGLKVLRQARLPKWRGCFQWQIEAKIEALQAEYATLRAEAAKEGG
jgi:hypothetical protein